MPTLVLALNPSIDIEWHARDVQWEEKNVIESERRWAGGKGVNVARWLRHLGANARVLLPLGGNSGEELRNYLRNEGITFLSVPVRQETRSNIIVTTARGRQLRFNPLGPELSRLEWKSVFDHAKRLLDRCDRVILSGSLPREAPIQTYSRFVKLGQAAGCKTFLDCDGPAFACALASRPFVVKPNEYELAQWAGRSLKTEREIIGAAKKLSLSTNGWVFVSRGGRGAFLIHARNGVGWSARVPKLTTLNTVGAGDAFLAAAASGLDERSPAEWLRWSVAAGTAATQCPAGELPDSNALQRLASKISISQIRTLDF